MNWFFATVRSVGASFPIASSLVQMNAELDSRATQERLRRLEDPVSSLHPDVRELGRQVYDALVNRGRLPIDLEADAYERFRRPLAMLEAAGYVQANHAIGQPYAGGFRPSAAFIAYMCAFYEEPTKLDTLVDLLDSSPRGTWLKGGELGASLNLPVPVVRAFFELYETRGLGILSKELGTANYLCQA